VLRELVQSNKQLVGTFISIPSTALVESIGLTGLDFLVLDMEHGEIGRERLPDLLRAADATDTEALVRVPEISRQLILPSLDAGAAGIMVPQVETAQQAREAVQQTKHPPQGKRGASLNRSTNFGHAIVPDCFEEANRNSMVCIQCESTESLENVENIAGVNGVDVLFVGPLDLSHSMGVTGELDHPRMKDACLDVQSVAQEHDRASGITATDHEELQKRLEQGFRFIVYSTDFLVLMEEYGSTVKFMEEYRASKKIQ